MMSPNPAQTERAYKGYVRRWVVRKTLQACKDLLVSDAYKVGIYPIYLSRKPSTLIVSSSFRESNVIPTRQESRTAF